MDLFLQNINPIAIKKKMKSKRRKRLFNRMSLKIGLESREVIRVVENYNKRKGKYSTRNKWNSKTSEILKAR